ncbi:MAG: ATP-binding protein [Microcoleaceae cyanobacterium]
MTAELVEPEALPEPLEVIQVKDVLAEGTGIALLGDSGAGKTSVCLYLAGEMDAEQVVVCNPHDDGRTWPDGITVYSDYDDIFNYLEQSLLDLEARKQLNRQRQPLTRLVEFLDEWPSVRVEAKRRKLDICERFIIRSGSECRKYNKLSVFCSHSGNVKALGLDGMGDFLENYSLIRLNKIALKYAKTHPDRRIIQELKSTAYCAMVNDELSVHPTHSHYQQVKDKQPPANIKPLRLNPVQNLVSPEVNPEVSLTEPNQTLTSPNPPLTTSLTGLTENYQVSELRLSEAVKAITEGGYSDTKIIKDILGMKGANYRRGKDLLSALKELI